MASQPHLQIYNTPLDTFEGSQSLSGFAMLPRELRLKVWRYSLECERIITIGVDCVRETPSHETAEAAEPYVVYVEGYQVLSKLFRVNSESRQAAMEFYRVHLPCHFRCVDEGIFDEETTRPGVLHFNPEYDFLYISYASWGAKDTLVGFLHQLKTRYDPRGIGLLNLAISINTINGNDLSRLKPSDVEPEVLAGFTETLTQLREVFVVQKARHGRLILGSLSGMPSAPLDFNRSLPIMAMAPTFDRKRRDPREISEDLKKIYQSSFYEGWTFQTWAELLQKWGVTSSQANCQFLLTHEPWKEDYVSDREGANRFLKKENDVWTKGPEAVEQERVEAEVEAGAYKPPPFFKYTKRTTFPAGSNPIGAESEKYKNEDLGNAVKPVFGFWLFPAGVVDAIARNDNLSTPLDLTEYWPGLALTSLP